MIKMYIDDIRIPKGHFDVITRNSETSKEYMIRYGCPNFISFDHDLGGDDTSIDIVKFMIEMDLDSEGDFIPTDFSWYVHSANPVGSANINGYLKSYITQKGKKYNEYNY